jgi:hypothetical protein
VIGETPQGESLFLALREEDWERNVCELLGRNPWRDVEPVGSLRRAEILLIRLGLAIGTHLPIGVIAPHPEVEAPGLTRPEVRKENTCTVAAALLAYSFAALLRIQPPEHSGVGDLA